MRPLFPGSLIRISIGGFLALASLLAGCVSHPNGIGDNLVHIPWKVPPSSVFLAQIPPPPANNSISTRNDLETILALQTKATPARIARAEATYNLTVFTFNEVLGPDFTPQRYPKTAKFFLELNDLIDRINTDLKDTFKRPHPFQLDPQVKQYVKAIPAFSYPSYHSARCEVFRRVLLQLDPGHKTAFHKVAHQVEEDRVFAGEHFPTDIDAGITLGKLIYAALERDENFSAGIDQLKLEEWTPPPGKNFRTRHVLLVP
jgi:acid phosphatase (class A)